jgi:hypothetical protein
MLGGVVLRARWRRAVVACVPGLHARRHHRACLPAERIHNVRRLLISVFDRDSEVIACERAVRARPSRRPCLARSSSCAPCPAALHGRMRAVLMRVDADEISQPDGDEAVVGKRSYLMVSGRAKACAARSFAGRTRCVMATLPPRPSLPPYWSLIASKLPDDIRIMVEAVLEDNYQRLEDKFLAKDELIVRMKEEVKLINESKNELIVRMKDEVKLINESKDELILAKDELIVRMKDEVKLINESKDEVIVAKDELIVQMKDTINEAKAGRLRDLRQYQVVYELRDTFDWLLRCKYPGDLSRPGALFNRLMDDLVDNTTRTLLPAYKKKYNELAAVFKVGQYEASSFTAIKGAYKELNNNMHGSNLIDIPDRAGIACGGKSRQQQQMHAFIIAAIQRKCADEGLPLDPALQTILVLKTDFSDVEGTVTGGRYTPLPMPSIA